ncbi:ProQ/FinO family protein [Uliginosibacterium sediminicola]|uniref:ProQ/FinO family protein n=1 Tax=Uliginosibacterium sediminicola TaxID=2024550 RepID=A0ABU9YXX2_9RHOO
MTEVPSTTVAEPSAKDLLKQLQQEFKVMREYLPLAIGIDKQLMALRPQINRKKLRAALGMHTHSLRYLKSIQAATQRFDLEGVAVGEVSEEQRALASKELFDRFKKRNEEHKASQAAKEKAEKAARAERERQEKLALLAKKFSRQ